jgi:hypothetical protein
MQKNTTANASMGYVNTQQRNAPMAAKTASAKATPVWELFARHSAPAKPKNLTAIVLEGSASMKVCFAIMSAPMAVAFKILAPE